MILVMVGRFHVALTATWGLAFGRGHYFTWLHIGALLFGWVNRHDDAGRDAQAAAAALKAISDPGPADVPRPPSCSS